MIEEKETAYRVTIAVVVFVLLLFGFVHNVQSDVEVEIKVPTATESATPKVATEPAKKVETKEPVKEEKPQPNIPPKVEKKPVAQTPQQPQGRVRPHDDWLAAAGIPASDFFYADFIIDHEGDYRPCVRFGGAVDCNYAINGGQAAYGVCQSKPGIKMAISGADWATNPITQLRWCHKYAQERYGGWQNAYNYWLKYRVW